MALFEGYTSFLAEVYNGCATKRATITVKRTFCPTCSHEKAGDGEHPHSFEIIDNIKKEKLPGVIEEQVGTRNCIIPKAVAFNADLSADRRVKMTWPASAYTDVKYEVAWDDGSFWEKEPRLKLAEIQATSFATEALNPLVTYRFSVRAINSCGTGPWAEAVAVTVN